MALAPAFRDLAERISSRRWLQVIIFAPLTLLTIAVLGIPSDIWDESLQRAYGLSVQTWGSWTQDWIVGQIIARLSEQCWLPSFISSSVRSPRRWWFYFWLASIPVLVIVLFLAPLVVEPLFYTFKPLQSDQPVLLGEMQKVIHRGGMEIPADRMFVMNASSKTTGLNAYVSGFGASKRVVVWDNTIAKAGVPGTLFVLWTRNGALRFAAHPETDLHLRFHLLFLLYLGYRLPNAMLARWGTQWGIRDLQDWHRFPS